MILHQPQETVPLDADSDGVIRVGGTRVTLETFVAVFRGGSSPEDIVQQFPSLVLPDVYAVIAYILRHSDTVDAYLAACEEAADRMRAEVEKISPQEEIRQRILGRHKQRQAE